MAKVETGKYRHYKGHDYEVIGLARHSETEEELVLYRPLYGARDLWVRPKEMFFEQVKIEGKSVPRFQKVSPETTMQAEQPFTLRKYSPEDRMQLIELWQSVFSDDPPHNEPTRMIDEKLKVDDLIFLAERDSTIIGACMAGYDGRRGWLYAVAVSPQQRRNGVGSALVRSAIDALRERGCQKIYLQIRSGNRTVSAFYESLGFTEEDRLSMGIYLPK